MLRAATLILFLALFSGYNCVIKYTDDAEADRITSLPGTDSLNITFNMFSGYLTVDEDHGRNIFYWLAESEGDPDADPVALWTNGGPGCSGLIGFMTEQGPFRAQADLTLTANEYAWNKVANMFFIEQPAGVGFSYSDTKSDYITGDWDAAQDNYKAILLFLERYPHLQDNDFFISAESYGGHYMPTLAKTIVDGNTAGENAEINFKGFAVGNPFTDPISNNIGEFETLYGHQVVSKPTFDEWEEHCTAPNLDLLKCMRTEVKLTREYGDLNPYALDYPICNDPIASVGRAQRIWMMDMITPAHLREARFENMKGGTVEGYEPCTDNYAIDYLNQKDVQTAIHAQSTVWTECSYTIKYNYSDSQTPMEPIYKYLIDGDYGLDILVYSGDDDIVCATIGTQDWIYNLGYEVTSSWDSWYYEDEQFGKQTGGYMVKFEGGLTFATVHGAGHEVPTYKPQQALDLFTNYVRGTL